MATAREIVASAHITKDPRVCGGKACIDNTRIRVIDVVQAQAEGHTPEHMQSVFAVPLTLAQIHLALAYAAAYPAEFEGDFAAGDRALAQIQKDKAEYLEHDRLHAYGTGVGARETPLTCPPTDRGRSFHRVAR